MVADAAFEAVDIDNSGDLDKEGNPLLHQSTTIYISDSVYLIISQP